jgi:ribonuclease VapC
MILDSSAFVAIVLREPMHDRLLSAIAAEPRGISVGAPTLVETTIVLSARLDRDARGIVGRLLLEGDIGLVPFTDAHYGTAMDAWLRYGRGRHPAALNFGDCMAYATARLEDAAVLFTGDDFAGSGVPVAPY